MAEDGAAAIPLWDTEGASGDTSVPEDLAAAYLVRKYLVDLAFGSIRYDWYAWARPPHSAWAPKRTIRGC